MSFNKLIPARKITKGKAMVRIGAALKKTGAVSTMITIADTQLDSLGWNKPPITHVCLFEGVDNDRGKLCIEPAPKDDEGAITLARFKYGGARITTAMNFADKPLKSMGMLPCTIESAEKGVLIINMPVEQWNAAGVYNPPEKPNNLTKRPVEATKPNSAPPVSNPKIIEPQSPMNILGQPITGDIYCRPTEYLAKKGIQLSKIGGDFWQYRETMGESERIDSNELLNRINKIRAKSGLPRIGKHQIVQEALA